jgi:phosphoserine phosphatase
MPIRLAAFDLDGTLIRGQNSLAVIGAALRHPEWERRMEILYMRGATPEEMGTRVAPWRTFSTEELCRPLRHARVAPGVDEAFQRLHAGHVTTAIVSISASARRIGPPAGSILMGRSPHSGPTTRGRGLNG